LSWQREEHIDDFMANHGGLSSNVLDVDDCGWLKRQQCVSGRRYDRYATERREKVWPFHID